MSGARLKDVSVLRDFKKLQRLDLSDNAIDDLSALADLSGLTLIDLTKNAVTSIAPLAKLPKLAFLYVEGNPLFNGVVPRTPENCPTGEGVNAQVARLCSKPLTQ